MCLWKYSHSPVEFHKEWTRFQYRSYHIVCPIHSMKIFYCFTVKRNKTKFHTIGRQIKEQRRFNSYIFQNDIFFFSFAWSVCFKMTYPPFANTHTYLHTQILTLDKCPKLSQFTKVQREIKDFHIYIKLINSGDHQWFHLSFRIFFFSVCRCLITLLMHNLAQHIL